MNRLSAHLTRFIIDTFKNKCFSILFLKQSFAMFLLVFIVRFIQYPPLLCTLNDTIDEFVDEFNWIIVEITLFIAYGIIFRNYGPILYK